MHRVLGCGGGFSVDGSRLSAHSGIWALLKDLPPGSSFYILPLFLIEQMTTLLTASLRSELFSLLSSFVIAVRCSSALKLLVCRRLTSLRFYPDKSTSTLLLNTQNLFLAHNGIIAKARRFLWGPFSQKTPLRIFQGDIPGYSRLGLSLWGLQSIKSEMEFPRVDQLNEAGLEKLLVPNFIFLLLLKS